MRHRLTLLCVLALLMTGCGPSEDAFVPACPSFGEDPDVPPASWLLAQSVPSATLVPCVSVLAPGWEVSNVDIESERSRFWLSSDRLGTNFLRVELHPDCDVTGSEATLSDEQDSELFRRVRTVLSGPQREGEYVGDWFYVYQGGCAVYHFEAEGPDVPSIEGATEAALSFFTRADLAAALRTTWDLDL